MMRALEKHCQDNWVLLYVKRWLSAPVMMLDGSLEERGKGTPQGGVISLLLANLYLTLCVRHVDAPEFPGRPVREVCR